MTPDLPHPAVQQALWPVLAILIALVALIVALRRFSKWAKTELKEVIAETVDVKAAVASALKEHQQWEAAEREADRKEWREDLREVREKVDRITERWLDRAFELLEGDRARPPKGDGG